jgi:hypothetical protein
MRWLCDVLLAVNTDHLGRTILDVVARGTAHLPSSPAYFTFQLGADGGWTPYVLKASAEKAREGLSSWPSNSATAIPNVRVGDFASPSGGPSPSFAIRLPVGVEKALVGWLKARGYGAQTATVGMPVDAASACIMRVTW